MKKPEEQVFIRETSLRDGLQSVATVVATPDKLAWLDGLHAAGVREAEVGSFVPPKLLPQLADTARVVEHALTLEGLTVSVLVPNLKGAERALESGAHVMTFPLSASREHSLANLRKTPEEAIAELGRMRASRDASGSGCLIEAGIGTAFGCTLQGKVEEKAVLGMVSALLDAGADRVSLADTVGFADPAAVERIFGGALHIAGERLWSAHFHDTRGLGLANVLAALRTGMRRFDSSTAGIGGCPHAPGASGNVTTEDMAFMLERMGFSTGVDIDRLLALRLDIARWLPGETLNGVLWRAGQPNFTTA